MTSEEGKRYIWIKINEVNDPDELKLFDIINIWKTGHVGKVYEMYDRLTGQTVLVSDGPVIPEH